MVELVESTLEANGPIDLFCSNAGSGADGVLLDAPDESWQQQWDLHVMAHLYAARAVVPSMVANGGGYLLNTASAAGLLAAIGSGLLCAAPAVPLDTSRLPGWAEAMIEACPDQPVPARHVTGIEHHVVARLDDALAAASHHARSIGYTATVVTAKLEGDALQAGREIASVLADKPGFSNTINEALKRGYAAITTDGGHEGGLDLGG